MNSDDPAFFGSSLENEYLLAHQIHGFDREGLKAVARNSFQASFLPQAAKLEWISRIEAMESTV